MGATSADTQREIEEIRKDVTSATEELYKRAHRLSARVTDVRAHSEQVRDNPAALGAAALAVAGIGGVAGARAYVQYRRRQRPEERLKRTVRTAAGELSERFERAREAIPLELHLGGRDDERDGRQPTIERKDPGMIKKMLWGALVASMVAAGGLLARRLSAAVWRAAMNEDPPSKSI